jgi:hypothetical protein
MKFFRFATMCLLAVALSGCGNGNGTPVNGNWSATLNNVDGSVAMTFTVALSENPTTGAVTVSNLTFNPKNPCFGSGNTGVGSFTNTTSIGTPTGSLQISIQSGATNTDGSNQLTLSGNLAYSSITGTWSLTGSGSGCSGSGNFSMGMVSQG